MFRPGNAFRFMRETGDFSAPFQEGRDSDELLEPSHPPFPWLQAYQSLHTNTCGTISVHIIIVYTGP